MRQKAYESRDEIIKSLGFDDYRGYLASDLWKGIRSRVLLRDAVCKLCDRRRSSQAHHYSYSYRTMVGETIDEIVGVCGSCHWRMEFKHNGKGMKRCFASVRHRTVKRMRKVAISKLIGPRRLCGAFYSDPTRG